MANYYHDSRAPYPYQAAYGLASSFPYRQHMPAQMPMRTPELAIGSAELHQHHPHPQHHNIAAHHQLLQPHHHHHHPPTQIHQNMAGFMQSEEDLAELQKLSNEYEPEVTVSETPAISKLRQTVLINLRFYRDHLSVNASRPVPLRQNMLPLILSTGQRQK